MMGDEREGLEERTRAQYEEALSQWAERVGQLTQELQRRDDLIAQHQKRSEDDERRITELEARGWELLDAIRKADNLGIVKAAGSLRSVLSTSKEET